jgi:hypothetical protein
MGKIDKFYIGNAIYDKIWKMAQQIYWSHHTLGTSNE